MIAYLVRHTAVSTPSGMCYGQSDVPLARTYKNDFKHVRAQLPLQDITACFSSPSTRCMSLAKFLRPGRGVKTDSRLLELNFGLWELQRWEQLNQLQAQYWGDHFIDTPCPGGESFLHLYERAVSFWSALKREYDNQTVLVVTHGGVIRSILAHIDGTRLIDAFTIDVPLGSVTKVTTR